MMNRDLIGSRLMNPIATVTPGELFDSWFVLAAKLRVRGAGEAVARPELNRRVRGAWGRCLMKGASDEARNRRPCPWSPPCALGVFFVEHGRERGRAISKPYTFSFERDGFDLIITLRVFGFACEWMGVASDRLVEAVSDGIRWSDLGLKNGNYPVSDVTIVQERVVKLYAETVQIRLVTPFLYDLIALRDRPQFFAESLISRISNLARWHDMALDVAAIPMGNRANDFQIGPAIHQQAAAFSNNKKHDLEIEQGVIGELDAFELTPEFSDLLSLAQTTGIGGGAVLGNGQYVLSVGAAKN